MAQCTFHIPIIHCPHCAQTIQSELGELEGVKRVEVDLAGKHVTVTFELPASVGQIDNLLREINYPPAR